MVRDICLAELGTAISDARYSGLARRDQKVSLVRIDGFEIQVHVRETENRQLLNCFLASSEESVGH
jgi:hypothetical protein